MKWVRRLIVAIIIVGIGAAIFFALQTPPVHVDVAEVSRGPLEVTVDEDGKTRIRERYVVAAPLAGRLLRIDIDPGDTVAAGKTVVATIEPSDPQLLNPRELGMAEARERAAEAALKQAEPAVDLAKAELNFAESELARQRELVKSKAASETRLELAEREYRTKSEAYRSATFSEEIARFELEQAQAALLPARSKDAPESARFQIASPIDGRVLRVLRESSTVVSPGVDLIEIGDPTDLELEIDILSSDAVQVRPGQDVHIEHWGGEKPLHGVVKLVEPSAFTKISALGVEEQRVNAIIDITDPVSVRETLGDGFRVEVRIVVWSEKDVVRVPTSALFSDETGWYVFVVREGVAIKTKIEIGRRNVEMTAVLHGLEEGTTVILHPNDQIADGTEVTFEVGLLSSQQ